MDLTICYKEQFRAETIQLVFLLSTSLSLSY